MLAQERRPDGRGLEDRVARVGSLLGELAALPDSAAQQLVEELMSTVLEMHGAGLHRILEAIGDSSDGGATLDRLQGDEVVKSLLLLHGLHPEPLRERVEAALETVRPLMRAHKGGVQLLGIDEGTVRLRLEGTCNGCAASAQTMRNAVETAIYDAAPDVEYIEVQGLAPEPEGPPEIDCLKPLPLAGMTPLPVLREHPSIVLKPVVRG